MKTVSEICREVTLEYLSSVELESPPDIADIRHELMDKYNDAIDELRESLLRSGRKMPISYIKEIPNAEIARLMASLNHVIRVHYADGVSDDDLVLMMYVTEGRNKGIYSSSNDLICNMIREYNAGATKKDCQEVIDVLNNITQTKEFSHDVDIVGVDNGIWDYKNKVLKDFSPEVILKSKSHVAYNPNAKNIIIHNNEDGTDWDVESWFNDLSDDPEIVELLWQIIGASIRPNVPFNKAVVFYSESGNNGKGTLCEVMRNLCGAESTYSLKLADFDKEFALEPVLRASLIIGDENNFEYIDKSSNFKAACTGDNLNINRKNKPMITAKYKGLIVECFNEYPRVKDKSDSFDRRLLPIHFEKCFTGAECKYIKEDYLKRQEVLEYILFKVLNMYYYELNEPESCKLLKKDYQMSNDPLLQFVDDIFPNLKWNFVPYPFLYELYVSWMKKYNSEGRATSKAKFTRDMKNVFANSDFWECVENYSFNTYNKDVDEPMIIEYGLTDWQRAGYKGGDAKLLCTPDFENSKSFRGLLRK